MDSVILTVEQAAEVGNVSVATVRAWILQGRLPVVQRRKGRVYVALGQLRQLTEATCERCGARFARTTTRQRFCSQRCRQAANRMQADA